MIIKKIEIKGFRGFETNQKLELAIPNAKEGSGLTILVGPNNSGKSTVIESFQAISSKYYHQPSFSAGKRNIKSGDEIIIKVFNENNEALILKSKHKGSSETDYIEQGISKNHLKVFVLPSRRSFDPFFSKNQFDRNSFLNNIRIEARRVVQYQNFQGRLFEVQKDPTKFNSILEEIFGRKVEWVIDLSDEGQHFVKLTFNESSHNSDGAGEGLLSIFTIVDSLYDSQTNEAIVIDEPELSLHPALQKRLFNVLARFSKDRQIIISTHSPYFVHWDSLINGGNIARIIKNNSGTLIHNLTTDVKINLKGLISGSSNPHILGLNANEVFFQDDYIILTEGQDDVIYFHKIALHLGINISGTFFGWGIGGAGNTKHILALLSDLGFKKVAVILDADKKVEANKLKKEYSHYQFQTIPTDDVRDKSAVKAKDAVKGLIDQKGVNFRNEYKTEILNIPVVHYATRLIFNLLMFLLNTNLFKY